MLEHRLNSQRIVVARDICHGKPRVAGTRIMVYQVLDLLAGGKSIDEIRSDEYFPELTVEDIFTCLRYASQINVGKVNHHDSSSYSNISTTETDDK